MLNDKEDLSLRDLFAIKILVSLLSGSGQDNLKQFMRLLDSDPKDHAKQDSIFYMERHIRASYKVADMMRKVRLSVFE